MLSPLPRATKRKPQNTMTATQVEPLTATFTRWNGEWMIKTSRPLTADDRITVERQVIGGTIEPVSVLQVEVTTRSGDVRTVEVAEYEKALVDGHIYSIRNI